MVLPFAVGFYPLRAAGAITFVWLDTRAAGAITFVWFGTKAAGAKGGGFEHEGGFVLVGAKAAVRLVGLGVIVVVS